MALGMCQTLELRGWSLATNHDPPVFFGGCAMTHGCAFVQGAQNGGFLFGFLLSKPKLVPSFERQTQIHKSVAFGFVQPVFAFALSEA